MIEIQNINAVNKGSLLATCDVYIKPWHYTFLNVMIFEKGAQRWFSMPTIDKEVGGELKRFETGKWDSDAVKNRFRNQIMGAIDKFLAQNPEMKPEDVIKEDEDLPF
jgi:hypothetical protein